MVVAAVSCKVHAHILWQPKLCSGSSYPVVLLVLYEITAKALNKIKTRRWDERIREHIFRENDWHTLHLAHFF